MNGPARPMSIGEFARAARLTVKALRHYDRERLLIPARVDPHTGYRYYTPDQLATALRIGLLRRANVSVPAIRVVLHDPDRTAEVLAAEHTRIEREAARAQRALNLVTSLEDVVAEDLPVQVHQLDDRTVLWREGRAEADRLDRDAAALIEALLADAEAAGIDTAAPVVGRYPVALDGIVEYEVGIETGAAASVPAGASVSTLPGGAFAGVDFTGPVALLPVAYHSLFEALTERGVAVAGPVREYYLADPAQVGDHAMRTRVVHPLPAGPAVDHTQP